MQDRRRPHSSSRSSRFSSAKPSVSASRPSRGSSRVGFSQGRPGAVRGGSSRARMNASGLDFSNSRRKKKADRGFVDHIAPTTRSGETDAQFSRRASRVGYAQDIQRKSTVKRFAFLALLVLLVIGVGVGVGVGVYFGQSNSKMSFEDDSVDGVLVEPVEGEAYYALCVAEMGTHYDPNDGTADAYLLVRIDEANKSLTFIGVPANLAVKTADGSTVALYEVLDTEGDAALVSQVSQFAGVDISHYAHTNAEGISRMVKKLDGLQITLIEELDDPAAGTLYLQAGEQELDGESTVALLRSSNYSNGFDTQNKNRVAVMTQMASIALSSNGLGFASELSSMADFVQTSWSSSALMDLGEAMRPFESVVIYEAFVPGYDSGRLYVESTAKWEALMANVKAGRDPYEEASTVTNVNRSSVTVEVRNGGGVEGAGAKMGELLGSFGYKVESVGNTGDGTIYPETLVVYKDSAYADAAEALVGDTGAGRVINGGDFYTFDANLLVVVGKEWVPAE